MERNFRCGIHWVAIDTAGCNDARVDWKMKNEVAREAVRVKGDAPEFCVAVFDS